jgi:hypothetical protein
MLRSMITTTTRTTTLSSSSPSRLISTSLPRLSSQLSQGEQVLKSKLETCLKGANVKVQDVSGM